MTTMTDETRALIRVGNELALVLDGPMLERLGITAETRMRVTEVGGTLMVSPQAPTVTDPLTDDVFDDAVRSVLTQYDKTFRKLAE